MGEKGGGQWRAAAELAGGTVGGMLQAVVGHPLDTIKTRLQAQGVHYRGPMDCFRRTVQLEGVRGLYKGLSGPLLTGGLCNAYMFAVNGTIKRWLAAGLGVEKTQLSLPYVCVAAWLTAPVYALLLTPIEVVKARLQFQSAGVEQLYRGPVDLILKTARAEGLAGFYHGYTATVLTRLIGSPFYFVSYEVTKRALQPADPAAPLPSSAILVAGGVGGTVFWAANFPADLVKTRLQTRRTTTPVSLSSVVKEVYRTDGLRGFYRGFTPCIIRAAPANAVAFWGLETTMRALGGKEGF